LLRIVGLLSILDWAWLGKERSRGSQKVGCSLSSSLGLVEELTVAYEFIHDLLDVYYLIDKQQDTL
jgi:hypothetical protein